MARRKKNPDSAAPAIMIGSAVALAGGMAFLFFRPKLGEQAPTGDVPLRGQIPQAGVPYVTAQESAAGAATMPTETLYRGLTFKETPAAYLIVLYTVRWVSEQGMWGQYADPLSFRGHVFDTTWLRKPIYTSPDDDVIAYLNALADTNPAVGFWLAYRVPIVDETAAHVPTRYGTPGNWMSGRVGDLRNLNSDPELAPLRWIGWKTEGTVSEYEMVGGIMAERVLAQTVSHGDAPWEQG